MENNLYDDPVINEIRPCHVAAWLDDISTDEEFVEAFAMYKRMRDGKDCNLKAEDIRNLDIDEVANTIKTILDEIIYSDEIYGWWKEEQ